MKILLSKQIKNSLNETISAFSIKLLEQHDSTFGGEQDSIDLEECCDDLIDDIISTLNFEQDINENIFND